MASAGPANLRDADAAAARSAIAQGGLVLLDFAASWCGPRRSLVPVIAELASRHPALTVLKVDVEGDGALAEEHSVRSVPALLLFKGGACIERATGKVPYVTLDRMVRRHLWPESRRRQGDSAAVAHGYADRRTKAQDSRNRLC